MGSEAVGIAATASVHPSAIVEDGAVDRRGHAVWHRSHVRAGARSAPGARSGSRSTSMTEVVVGDGCKIQNHVNLYRGVTPRDDVFVGPSATFTNDLHPRADARPGPWCPTVVGDGASIGANATIVCGTKIGAHAMVGAGAVVTADVAAHALVIGAPARRRDGSASAGTRSRAATRPLPAACPACGRDDRGGGRVDPDQRADARARGGGARARGAPVGPAGPGSDGGAVRGRRSVRSPGRPTSWPWTTAPTRWSCRSPRSTSGRATR